MGGCVHQMVCTHSNVAHILRKDPQIGLERAYLAKASIYYLSVKHQKGDFVMTFFNSYAKVIPILKLEIHQKAVARSGWRGVVFHSVAACVFNLMSHCVS